MMEHYLFDLYGTLVDIHTDEAMPGLWRRMAFLLSLQGAVYAPRELKAAYLAAVAEQAEVRSAQRPTVPEEHVEPDILAAFAALYVQKGAAADPQQVRDAAVFFRTLSMRHIRLYPHAAEVLDTLRTRGKGVYLVSNAQAAFTVPELKALGLYDRFDGIVLSSDVGVKKPDPAIFQHVLDRFRLRPEDCLMVGNDEAADMLGAAHLGIPGRYIHTKQSPPRQHSLPDACREIKSLKDLLQTN